MNEPHRPAKVLAYMQQQHEVSVCQVPVSPGKNASMTRTLVNIESRPLLVTLANGEKIVVPRMSIRVVDSTVLSVEIEPVEPGERES